MFSALDLPHDVPHFIDVVSTEEGRPEFRLATESTLFRYDSLRVSSETYRLRVLLSGDNVKPVQICLSFKWSGDWNEFEITRLND